VDAPTINKTLDRADLHLPKCRLVLAELFGLMRRMQAAGAQYSSWYGQTDPWPGTWEHVNRGSGYEPWPGNPDELRVPWFLLWEIAWIVVNTPMRPAARVLDMGGAGSLFSCYLASRGHEVHAIDLQQDLCCLAATTARRMGWRVQAHCMDMTRPKFPNQYFDHVFSVCVFEHLPVSGRIASNERVAAMLAPGGTAAYTFDYDNPQSFGRLDTPADVHRQLIAPSKLRLRGGEFRDTGLRYLQAPQHWGFSRFTRAAARLHAALKGSIQPGRAVRGRTSYTIGALFLEKPDGGGRP
jgi:hypothetical protein